MSQKYMIPFFIGCFSAGCLPAARRAAEQGNEGMARFWKILSAIGFVIAGVSLLVQFVLMARGNIQ